MRRPSRFYGEPVERFMAMANSPDEFPIDRAHFRMWCRIAADEITYARASRALPERDETRSGSVGEADSTRSPQSGEAPNLSSNDYNHIHPNPPITREGEAAPPEKPNG